MYRLLALLLLLTAPVAAQLAPPDFLCTRSEDGGEILTWQNVTNDCGPYQATEIYRADAPQGPYTLLAELTDPAQTEYRDENPTGALRFYYLRYRYDCSGAEVLTSDTLDSFIPVTPVLQYVSVEVDDLVLGWEPSPSPEVSGYVILEVTPGGINPLDTVSNEQTTYRIPDVPFAERTTRQFRIAAIDPCGNDSPQSRVVTAQGLTGSGGQGCVSAVTLTATGGVEAAIEAVIDTVLLFASVDGGGFTEVPYTVADDGVSLVFDGGNDGERICFFAGAQVETDTLVRTDTFCLTLDITPPVRPFDLYGVEIDGATIRLPYERTNNPLPTEAFLNSFTAGTLLAQPLPPADLTQDELTAVPDTDINAVDSFLLVVRDECERTVPTNAVAPVRLAVAPAAGGGGAELVWTPLVNNLPGQITYTVLQVLPDGSLNPVATDLSDLTYLDASPAPPGGPRCYRISASFVPANFTTAFPFLSNAACLFEEPRVYFPNVFRPSAQQPINRVFGPQFQSPPQLASYRLQVFDRWGALVFESDNPGLPWLGDYAGRDAPTGSYLYLLTYTTPTGNSSQLTGVVQLIR